MIVNECNTDRDKASSASLVYSSRKSRPLPFKKYSLALTNLSSSI